MAKLVALDGGDLYINLDMIESIRREPDPSHRNFLPDRALGTNRESPMVTIVTMQSGTEHRTEILPADVIKLGA